jgi:hypothetical protein
MGVRGSILVKALCYKSEVRGSRWKIFSDLPDPSGRSRKLGLTALGDLRRWPRDTLLSTKVGTKFSRQVAVAQSAD